MRTKLFLLCLVLSSFAILTPAVHADLLPIGTYWLSADTPTSGIHSGSDVGTLTGTLTFDASSILVSADLVFDDITSGKTFSFTNPGATNIQIPPPPPGLVSATIYNAINPSELYQFSIRIPSNSSGVFTLNCGTDCDTWMLVNDGGPTLTYVEVAGTITPVPEPSSLMLFGTGLFGAFTVLRAIHAHRKQRV
ncbi:PEP-CTERM sorting domain-containing protein [Edaphobacter albus]|uniref:PEP-CTERM sorting domain-containing protein n=1 Tax=Edaphobacter sp. 4G125 TaxID=2763071 RepID=UPI001647BA03|nr:PEP-CTERM sorting domain-containing protein [Edaphobacter sp. 4G125]QNI36920.1 PEP-CTERM sorting domain-containing protein [Edaphobacter sp. 4G125]